MWLNVMCSSPQEQLYYDLLLTLFSVLTEVTDFQLEGKGQGVIAPCKIMIQNVLKVCLYEPLPLVSVFLIP